MNELIHRITAPVVSVAIVSNAIGTLVIFLLVGIMNVDIIARGVFHSPLRGVVEIVIFSLVLIVFLQLPDVVRSDINFRNFLSARFVLALAEMGSGFLTVAAIQLWAIPDAMVASFTTVNLALRLINEKRKWAVEAFVYNATDETVRSWSDPGPGYLRANFFAPRIYGLKVRKDW